MTPKLASQEHEAQLKRLMELQQGFVRSTHISESALESIRAKKEKIKKSQSLADKRRELAKKAVAAQDDEQMFQALFETVHTDLRSQQKSLEEAKQAIENLQQERVEDKDIFENEKNELFETLEKQKSEIRVLTIISKTF